VQWQLLPVQGYQPLSAGLWPFAESLILPSVALGVTYMALIARITRASMLEVLQQDYIRTANAKGLATDRVLLLHALKNASVPIVTVIGIGIALLISGVVITETVFNIPGLGRLIISAVLRRDYPVVQGVVLLIALTYTAINLLVDLAYLAIDPRIRFR
jgi:peptide/nickel transport system permease protein